MWLVSINDIVFPFRGKAFIQVIKDRDGIRP